MLHFELYSPSRDFTFPDNCVFVRPKGWKFIRFFGPLPICGCHWIRQASLVPRYCSKSYLSCTYTLPTWHEGFARFIKAWPPWGHSSASHHQPCISIWPSFGAIKSTTDSRLQSTENLYHLILRGTSSSSLSDMGRQWYVKHIRHGKCFSSTCP